MARLTAVSADKVKARHHKWLAAPPIGPTYWGLGTLTFLDAQQGTGKSLVTIDLTAAVTRGWAWPDGGKSTMRPGNVLLSNVEDDEDADQVPRLIAAGADLKRVKFAKDIFSDDDEPHQLYFPADLEPFEDFIKANRIKLAVIDPAISHMKLRHGLTPTLVRLREIAKAHECTIILIRHIPGYLLMKPAGLRGGGGHEVASNARMGYDLLIDEAARRNGVKRVFLRSGKNNWTEDQPPRAFFIRKTVTEIEDSEFVVPRIGWEERVIPEEEILASLEYELKKDAKTTITDWLERKLLAAGDLGVERKKLMDDAISAGFTSRAIDRASKDLEVVKRNTGRPRESGGVVRVAYWYHKDYAPVIG